MLAFEYKPEVHEIREVPLTKFLQKRYRNPDIFVYFHHTAGNWSVGEWLPGEKYQMLEDLRVIGPEIEGVGGEDIAVMDYLIGGPTVNAREEIARRNTEREWRAQEKECWEVEKWVTRNYGPLSLRENPIFKGKKVFGTS